MNCNQNSGCPPRRSGMMPGPMPCQTCMGQRPMPNQPCPGQRPMPNQPCPDQRPMPNQPCPTFIGPNMAAGFDRYPVGMGYVPMQNWETPFPMEHGFRRGTIFPSLDYPFVMGRCRR